MRKVVLIASANDLAGKARAQLRRGPFISERTVLPPVPAMDLAMTQRLQTKRLGCPANPPRALERLGRYIAFSMSALPAAHPDLTDDQAVLKLRDGLTRIPHESGIESMLLRHANSMPRPH